MKKSNRNRWYSYFIKIDGTMSIINQNVTKRTAMGDVRKATREINNGKVTMLCAGYDNFKK